jgi:hypothetical protein
MASAKDVDGFRTSITIHGAVPVVWHPAYQAWLPCFNSEQLILLHNHIGVYLCFLCLVLNGIAVDDGAADGTTDLDHVESRTTYGTAVRALDPRRET